MKKCSALVLLACAFALLTAERVAAAPVTWDFIATSCSGPAQYPQRRRLRTRRSTTRWCSPPSPLTGPDSSGAASTGLFPTSGDPFAFDLVAAQGLGTGRSMVSTADPTGPISPRRGCRPPLGWSVTRSRGPKSPGRN